MTAVAADPHGFARFFKYLVHFDIFKKLLVTFFVRFFDRGDISELLSHIPQCKAIVTTGQKATDTLCQLFSTTAPSIGSGCPVCLNGRNLTFFRMPSSSRAYPLSLERKAAFYKGMLETVGILNGQ